MAQIIMLGTEGCGKTMLLTVLAQRYRSVSENGYFLEAMNGEANAFTNQNWHILKEQHEWPPATPPGALRDFRWQLHTGFNNNGSKLELVAADFAGEVFRAGFGRDDWSSIEAQQLKQYVSQADALLLLINLKDLIDEQDIHRKSETEWSLKNCLDYGFGQGFRQLAVAFTQTDRYEAIFAECDGEDRTVLHKYLPQIYGAYPNIEVLRVAAVSGTTLDEDAEGLAIERPTENFGSVGIPDLLTWISKTQSRKKKECEEVVLKQAKPIARLVVLVLAALAAVAVIYFEFGDSPPIACTWMLTHDNEGHETYNCRLRNEGSTKLSIHIVVSSPTGPFDYNSFPLDPRQEVSKLGWYEGWRFNPGDKVTISAAGYRNSLNATVP